MVAHHGMPSSWAEDVLRFFIAVVATTLMAAVGSGLAAGLIAILTWGAVRLAGVLLLPTWIASLPGGWGPLAVTLVVTGAEARQVLAEPLAVVLFLSYVACGQLGALIAVHRAVARQRHKRETYARWDRRQFSVQHLLRLTTLVAIVLGAAVSLHAPREFWLLVATGLGVQVVAMAVFYAGRYAWSRRICVGSTQPLRLNSGGSRPSGVSDPRDEHADVR
ncbi:MAG: hypothetical protein CMJ58_01315 [Planctomycetaceae bacterium]|nr:hypothetical protein [Planctomycetaceae bacterium]